MMRLLCAAAAAAALAGAADQHLRIGGEDTGRLVSRRTAATVLIRLGPVVVPMRGEEFRLVLNGRTYSRADFRPTGSTPVPGGTALRLAGALTDVEVVYTGTPLGMIRKALRLRPHKDVLLERLDVESLVLPPEVEVTVARGAQLPEPLLGRLPICAFLARQEHGAFFSLDFAISEIDIGDGTLRVGYAPYQEIPAGSTYESHSVTFGAYRLAGRRQGPYDAAAAAAFRRYVRFDYAPPFLQGPQLIYTSIVNRYTEIDRSVPVARPGQRPIANTIFYTLSDANYFMLHPDNIPGEIDLARSLSMEWCQLYEGPFEWIEGNPPAAVARRIGEYARNRGVRLGLYTGANQLTAPHFNHFGQDKGRPEWKRLDAFGKRGAYCWGSAAFARWFADTLIEASRNYNFRQANFDFLEIAPCEDAAHGHAAGEKGLYRQIANLVRTLDTIRASVPGYTYDSNLGWLPFVPKIAKSMDAFYLNDPHFTVYFPTLNTVEALDNSRRYEMVSYFLNFLTPVEYFRNCEYFVTGDSVVRDAAVFEFGILQGLALTPNLQLGEARALLDRLSPADQERLRQFLARWTGFVRENWEYYANTLVLGDLPRVGQVELYAHAKGDRSFVFAVNANPFSARTSIALDASIGLEGSGPYLIHELYPEDRLIAGRSSLEAHAGETVEAEVPARTVNVLEIGPAPGYSRPPLHVAGIPAAYDRFADHYRVQVEAWQGETRQVLLFPPPGESIFRVEVAEQPLNVRRASGGYQVSVQFPKERVAADVLDWRVSSEVAPAGAVEVRLPLLDSFAPAANFLGARIENLLNEKFTRELLVHFQRSAPGAMVAEKLEPARRTALPNAQDLDPGWVDCWYSARFSVAYVQAYVPPPPDQHNYISLNFKHPRAVREIKAWLNGKEAAVERYRPWRGPEWAVTWYLDGSRAGLKRGENELKLLVGYTKR
jgi:hypothetical protein